MPPPQLAADAPVPDVLHPVLVHPCEPLRHQSNLAPLHQLQRRPRQRLHPHEPLPAHQRLHHLVAPLAMPHRVPVRLHPLQQPLPLQPFDNRLPGLEAVQARIRPRLSAHRPVQVDGRHDSQPVPLPYLEVVRVMPRRHLQRPRAKLDVHRLVPDDRDLPPQHRQHHPLPHEPLVSPVCRVHRHRRVTQQRLRPSRRHRHRPIPLCQPVANVIQVALQLLVYHLQVGQRCGAARAPVDDPLPLVDQPFSIEVHKRVADGPARARVQREALPAPIAGHPQPPVLLPNAAPVPVHPLPHPLKEPLPPQVMAREALLGDLPLHHHLRRNPRVVKPRQQQRGLPQHPMPPRQRVLHCGSLRVTQVELPCHVGRRLYDHEGLPSAVDGCCEIPAIQP